MNFYKRYMGDYARDTAHLSLAEHGAYTLLLDHYYSTERPLPSDMSALYRICRAFTEDEQEAVRKVASTFFTLSDSGLCNPRAERQIPDDRRLIDVARENGKRGGRPRKRNPAATHNETQTKPTENPVGFQNETQRVSQMEPSENPAAKLTRHQTPEEKQDQKRAAAPIDFRADLFKRWKAQPDSGGGAFLNKLFRDHKPEQRVIEAVERTIDHGPADPKAFVLGVLRKEAHVESEYDDLMRRVC